MNIKIVFSVIPMLLVVSCASINPTPFVGPSGKSAYSMQCSGMRRTMDDCYKKAGEICPNGYAIVDHSSNIVGSGGLIVTNEALVIECK